jgi:anthranilate phosphoribosyltransferase
VGLARSPLGEIPGGDPEQNAATARAILAGESGPARDLAVLNAGAAIYVGAGAGSLEQGVRRAEQAIDSGSALASLDRFVARTRELAP